MATSTVRAISPRLDSYMGVREYFLFDPYGETSHATLRGFRLEGGEYTPMHGTSFHSEVLGLELRVEDGLLCLYDPKTGERLHTPEEAEIELRLEKAARQIAEDELAARQAAEAKAAAAEAEITRLRQELAKQRGTNA
jgi:hypothetical protein